MAPDLLILLVQLNVIQNSLSKYGQGQNSKEMGCVINPEY